MATAPSDNPQYFGKRDLHVGGLSAGEAAGAISAAVDPLLEASENWMRRVRELGRSADDFVRENPWQAMGVAALLGVTVGFLLARRT